MFSYLENTYARQHQQVATIDELLKLCKAGEVARVIIPMTYNGYGSTLVDDSNSRSIERAYPRARFTREEHSLTMSAQQFIRNEHYREMIRALVEDCIVFNDQDHSELETETQLEFLVDEISYVLINDETSEIWDSLPDTLAETKAVVEEVLCSGDWQDNIEWWEYVIIDNDGYTPYATKEQVAELATLVSVRYLEMKAAGEL